MPGKHSQETIIIKELENQIELRNKEIIDIKTECAEQFRIIRNLCFCNTYNGKLDRLKRIEEIAQNNFSAIVKDLIIEQDEKNKIIELPYTVQRKR
jgi:hypothetical protein